MGKKQITTEQAKLLTHTLGIGRGEGRNYFNSDSDGKDVEKLNALVDLGMMTRQESPSWMGGGFIYRATDKGRDAVN